MNKNKKKINWNDTIPLILLGFVFILEGAILVLFVWVLIMDYIPLKSISITIYKEELATSEEVYDYCLKYCEENPENVGCINFPCSNLIKQVEVDEISYKKWDCSVWKNELNNLEKPKIENCTADIILDNGVQIPECYYLIKKKDLTTDWLDRNCGCLDSFIGMTSCKNEIPPYCLVETNQFGLYSFNDSIDECKNFDCGSEYVYPDKCSRYKCGEYIVEIER